MESFDDLRNSRSQLVGRARRLAQTDDIRPRIMKEAAGIARWTEVDPAMFEGTLDQEMVKYEKFRDTIEENEEKQAELVESIKASIGCTINRTVYKQPRLLGSKRAIHSITER